MLITKRDTVTIVILTLVFLAIGTWALGMYSVPTTTWQSYGIETFYVDLGSVRNVSSAYVLVAQGSVSFSVYTGQPGNWTLVTQTSMENYYYQWGQVRIDEETRFIRFAFAPSDGEVAELSALDGNNNQKIVIKAIQGENTDDKGLANLTDEQNKVECPPTYMSETYFDEIYYVPTAKDYLNLKEPAVIADIKTLQYEWTQPPLGKLIIAASISLFGDNPFGWRMLGVLFAALMIPIIYLLGKKMFGTWIGAFLPAFLLTFDFMHFTMARIATVDTYLVFFSLLSQLFFFIYLKNVLSQGWKTPIWPLLLSTIFFALALSTKWYALPGFVGDITILLFLGLHGLPKSKGFVQGVGTFLKPLLFLVIFLLMAVGIYVLTYVPNMLAGSTLLDIYHLQWSMLHYHEFLTAPHPFSAPWWSWPLMTRPVWLYVSNLPNGIVSTIADMGNPAIWWIGFASVIIAAWEGFRTKSYLCLFIVTIFLFQWVPYVLISRVLFLYAFYSNVPIMILATTYFINKSWKTRQGKILVLTYLIVVALLFAVFYPVISGVPAPDYWREGLKWLRSWVF